MTRLGRSYPFFLLPLLSAVRAQFYWSFPSQNDSNSLSSCESIPVTVWENPGASGVSPPFWVYSYPTKGVPSVQLLEGEGLVNLTYEVRYPQGTELIISVYDSNNHNGGWGRAYTIQSGSTGCLPSTDTPIHVSLNTSQADTCDSVLFSISGGTPPYTVNVIPDTSTNTVAPTTNDTLPASDAYYSWVADVTSGSGMLVGVRDSKGIFSATQGPIDIGGQNQTGCATQSQSFASPPGSGGSNSGSGGGSSTPVGAIVGGVVGGVVLAIILLLLARYLYKRRRVSPRTPSVAAATLSKSKKNKDELDPEPKTPMLDAGEADLPFSPSKDSSNGRTTADDEEEDYGVRGEKATAIVDPYLPPDEEVGEGSSAYPAGAAPSAWRRRERDAEEGSLRTTASSQWAHSTDGGVRRMSSTAKPRASTSQPFRPRIVNPDEVQAEVVEDDGQERISVDDGVLAFLRSGDDDRGEGSSSRPAGARASVPEKAGLYRPSAERAQRKIMQHEDGGAVPVGEEEVLPPTYDSVKGK